jgi:hypothetical protein
VNTVEPTQFNGDASIVDFLLQLFIEVVLEFELEP